MKNLYIIAGPNGAGKTTLSYTILPEIFKCEEFVNADEIARGISPFNQDGAAIKAGRIMLQRIHELIDDDATFAFETTLSTKSYTSLIKSAQHKGYEVILLFLMLDSVKLAEQRVATRVKEGGHDIPKEVIKRRYHKGLRNFFDLYMAAVDKWMLFNNSGISFEYIAEGYDNNIIIGNHKVWTELNRRYNGS